MATIQSLRGFLRKLGDSGGFEKLDIAFGDVLGEALKLGKLSVGEPLGSKLTPEVLQPLGDTRSLRHRWVARQSRERPLRVLERGPVPLSEADREEEPVLGPDVDNLLEAWDCVPGLRSVVAKCLGHRASGQPGVVRGQVKHSDSFRVGSAVP